MINDKPEKENIKTNPLEELLEDESQVSERGASVLKDLIKPFAFIGSNTKKIVFRDEAFELPTKLRIYLLFACGLAMKDLGYSKGTFSQKEILGYFVPLGIPEGTVKVTLKQLRDDRLITEAEKNRYETGYDKILKIQSEYTKHGRKDN